MKREERKGGRLERKDGVAGDMTPMIDVTFQLIIFFMLQKFRTLEGKLSAFLPKDAGVTCAQAPRTQRLDVHVYLAKKGSFRRVQGRKVWSGRKLEWKVDAAWIHSKAELERLLARVARTREDPRNPGHPLPVAVHAHPGVQYGEVTDTVDAILYAGFEKVLFAGGRAR